MKRTERTLPRRAARSRSGLALLIALMAGSAGASPTVYHSEAGNGVDATPGAPGILASSTTEPVHVYVTRGGGLSGGTVCDPSNDPPGDEICGADVRIQIQGAGQITGSLPATDVEHHVTTGNKEIRMAIPRAAPTPPANANPLFLGTIQVDTTSAERTDVIATGMQIVNAKRDLEQLPVETIATTFVPEPGFWLQLVPGLLGIAALHRLKRRRARGAP